jgi:hypothetical protein
MTSTRAQSTPGAGKCLARRTILRWETLLRFDTSEGYGTGVENESDQPVEIELWEYDEVENKMTSLYRSDEENQ